MSDDRDRRRPGDPLHRAVAASGEFESRDDITPVEVLRRIERKIDEAQIAADVDADMPEHFARLEKRCAAAEARAKRAEEKADRAERRWKWPMRIISGLGAFALAAVTWVIAEVRSSGYDARVTEEYRALVERLNVEVRANRETLIRFGERLNAWRPIGTLPISGPHNKDE